MARSKSFFKSYKVQNIVFFSLFNLLCLILTKVNARLDVDILDLVIGPNFYICIHYPPPNFNFNFEFLVMNKATSLVN